MKHNDKDFIGKKFNKLTVLEIFDFDKIKRVRKVKVLCDCGQENITDLYSLLKNKTQSCGCLHKELRTRTLGQTWSRKPPGEAGLTRVILTIKSNAKSRNLSYTLTREEIKELTSQNCHYCDKSPLQVARTSPEGMTEEGLKNSEYYYNGLDRINNDEGYSKLNCVPCCSECNSMKTDMHYVTFLKRIRRIYENKDLKNILGTVNGYQTTEYKEKGF